MKMFNIFLVNMVLLGSLLKVCAEASPTIFQNLRIKRQAQNNETLEDLSIEDEDNFGDFADRCFALYFGANGGECGEGLENIREMVSFPFDLGINTMATKATCYKDL